MRILTKEDETETYNTCLNLELERVAQLGGGAPTCLPSETEKTAQIVCTGDHLPAIMNFREKIMSRVVPGQFDDAELSDSEQEQIEVIQQEKRIIQMQPSHLYPEADVDEFDDSGEDNEDDWDWDDSVGKVTKRNLVSGGRNTQVRCGKNWCYRS
uniref:Uncharacterized protein n=1 Tax=Sphaerodactylus townsendi TaxID=933632 RepID=A0ACB8FC55_9SAUR